MMRRVIYAFLCISTVCSMESEDFIRKNVTQTQSAKHLSRHKRYLIFPEGSSLQLVYCLTMPVIGKSTIFTIGGTAALAWELPHDPFSPYRKKAEVLHRKDPPGEYTIQDRVTKEKQSVQSTINLSERFDQFVSSPIGYDGHHNRQKNLSSTPTFRLPSISYSPAYNRYQYQNYLNDRNRRRQPLAHHQQQFSSIGWQAPVYYRFVQPKLPIESIQLTQPKDDRITFVNNASGGKNYFASPEVLTSSSSSSIYHQVHRRTRRELYSKIEKFLSTQSKDGKSCLLRAICEVHQKGNEKGSFLEEIIKVVFRVKHNDDKETQDIYDQAANKKHNCSELYSNCDSSILNLI